MYFDINEATILCGYDKKRTMISYLCRQKLVFPSKDFPSGKGRKRLFTFRDLLILKIFRKMLDTGLSVISLKKALEESEDFQSFIATPTDLKCNNRNAHYLVTDGKSVYFHAKKDQVVEMGTSGQYVFSFMVDVGSLHSELTSKVMSLNKERSKTSYRSRYLSVEKRRAQY